MVAIASLLGHCRAAFYSDMDHAHAGVPRFPHFVPIFSCTLHARACYSISRLRGLMIVCVRSDHCYFVAWDCANQIAIRLQPLLPASQGCWV